MTKSQKKIYDWLKERPGYLQKSIPNICDSYPNFNQSKYNKEYDNVLVAVKQLKEDLKKTKPVTKEVVDLAMKAVSKDVINPKVVRDKIVFTDNKAIITPVKGSNTNRFTPGTYYITGCVHAPWQNKAMYEATLNYLAKEVELEGLIIAGDGVDLNSLSSHDKGKVPIKGVTLDWEYAESCKFLDELDDLKINGTRDYIFGNHEDRYIREMKDVNTAKLGKALKSPQEGLKLEERGYSVYTDWKNDAIHLGPYLDVSHGEFLNVHSAKKTIDTYRKSCVYFHTHRFQIFVEGLVGGFNMGFGGDIKAPIFNYATRAMKNSWLNASCQVTLDGDGYYHIEPLMFINNKLIVNGKEY